MTLHLHHWRWRPIICPSSETFLNFHKDKHVVNFRKGCIPIAIFSLLPVYFFLCGTPGLPVVHLLIGRFHRFHPDTVTRAKILTEYQYSTYSSEPPPPMIGGTFMFLYVVLLVNKCHYWLGCKKKKVCCKTFHCCTREMTLS